MAKAEPVTYDATTGEVLETSAVAVQENNIGGVMVGGAKFKVKELVNVPTLKHETGQTVAFKIEAPIYETTSKQMTEVIIEGKKTMAERETVISVVRVREVTTGQIFEYVCNAITQDSLRSAYPNDGYVGKWFAIRKLERVAGKLYKDVQIVEIEPDEEAVQTVE